MAKEVDVRSFASNILWFTYILTRSKQKKLFAKRSEI